METFETIIIGAGSAGLACFAALKHKGKQALILEKESNVGSRWRGHYERLHLHTDKKASSLPHHPMTSGYPKYPSRDQVVKYLEEYAEVHDAKISFNTEVVSGKRWAGRWHIATSNGKSYQSDNLIVSTGRTNRPHSVTKPGIENFAGKNIHSCDYVNGREFENQDVLVIGFGNSGCEIAVCLHEHGARPSMSVRSPVNVVPRDIFGIPALSIGKLTAGLAPKVSDMINKPIINFLYGDITKYGLRKLPYGPVEQINVHKRIPLLDIGTIELIRKGFITIYPDIQHVGQNEIEFVDGRSSRFDAIIMATGYEHRVRDFIEIDDERIGQIEEPIRERESAGKDGLYLCGYYVSPRGMLNEAGKEALFIANHIAGSH